MKKNILPDGSVEGETFSGKKYTGEFPRPIKGETYKNFRARVDECTKQGFDLGDLGWDSWSYYCMGSCNYDGVDCNDVIK